MSSPDKHQHLPTASKLGRSIRKVWVVGVALIVLSCIITPALVQPLFWICLAVTCWKLARFVQSQTTPSSAPESDTCRRCDALLFMTTNKQWVAFSGVNDCAGRRHQPFGESAATRAS